MYGTYITNLILLDCTAEAWVTFANPAVKLQQKIRESREEPQEM